ncbi:MAG: PIN domain-containing protein [Planctomycetota bacterium]
MVDTDVLIDLEDELDDAMEWLEEANATDVVGCVGFSVLEVLEGAVSKRQIEYQRQRLAMFTVIWPSENTMQGVLEFWCGVKTRGGLGWPDALIGCTALAAGLPLHTFNDRHFRDVTGLRTVRPYNR